MMIRDQRTMIGPKRLSTVEEVEAAWEAWRISQGFRRRDDDPHGEWVEPTEEVVPFVSDGRWVADCPSCRGGIACWSENPRGACLSCGTIFPVRFPDQADEVEAVLAERPDPLSRHWRASPGHKAERVDDLVAENVRRGLRPGRPEKPKKKKG